jgi:hypothetical protein
MTPLFLVVGIAPFVELGVCERHIGVLLLPRREGGSTATDIQGEVGFLRDRGMVYPPGTPSTRWGDANPTTREAAPQPGQSLIDVEVAWGKALRHNHSLQLYTRVFGALAVSTMVVGAASNRFITTKGR